MSKLNLISETKTIDLFTLGNKTMSSREIAKLINKPHDNVLKVIKSLIDGGIVKSTIPRDYVNEQNKQIYTEYFSDKRDCYIIVARLSPVFMAKIIDRWIELEGDPLRAMFEKITLTKNIVIANGSIWGKAGMHQKKNKLIVKSYEEIIVKQLHQELDLLLK